MSVRGVTAVTGVECRKLVAQLKAQLLLAACIVGPFVFAAVIRLQSSVPADTLFGRAVKESGFAVPLLTLGFAALWLFPVIGCIVGGDVFSAEDRYGTWKTILTRSLGRADFFTGKVLAALLFALVTVTTFAVCSIAAGVLIIGTQPLINLSGIQLPPWDALRGVALAWASVVPPTFAFTAIAVLLSIATRSSAAGIGLPVVATLTMQLYSLVDGPEPLRRALLTSAFSAWHGLLTEPRFYRPLFDAVVVSGVYALVCFSLAYRLMWKRDIGG